MTQTQPATPAEKGDIKSISFPNNAQSEADEGVYTTEGGYKNCDEVRQIIKEDEERRARWFQIIRAGKVVAEIKESVCNIYFK